MAGIISFHVGRGTDDGDDLLSPLDHGRDLGLTYAANDSDPIGEPGPEQTLVRLSNGTRLVEPGAIAPGVTVL